MQKNVKRRSTKDTQKRYAAMTVALFAVAGIMILTGAVGGTRAALLYSQTYESQLEMQQIGIALNENGKTVADGGNLLEALNGKATPGVLNREELTVTNTGTIDEYVRLIVYKYWEGKDGKDTDLDPSLITLTLGEGWIEDQDASTAERTVLYYTKPLAPKETTTAAITGFTVSSDIQKTITETSKTQDGLTTITTTYDYDGTTVGLEAEADGVQTHNAQDAILSAWGVKVTVASDGTLSK